MSLKKRTVIIGARQHAKVVCSLLRSSSRSRREVELVGFLDDDTALLGKELLGLPILGPFKELLRFKDKLKLQAAIMGISNRHMRVRTEYFATISKLGMGRVNAIHDSAVVDPTAKLGVGVVLNPLCVVNAFASIGDNFVAYSGSTVEHEDVIGDNVYLGPGVNFASGVKIGDNTFIGAGVKIIPDISVGSNVVIGAGSVVIENVRDNAVVVGAPGREVRSSRQG